MLVGFLYQKVKLVFHDLHPIMIATFSLTLNETVEAVFVTVPLRFNVNELY